MTTRAIFLGGDRLPHGAPALMVSPQAEHIAIVRPDLVRKRDQKYGFNTEELKASRADVEVPADEELSAIRTALAHVGLGGAAHLSGGCTDRKSVV